MIDDRPPLTTGQRALVRQAPADWTDVPRFADSSAQLAALEKAGYVEQRSVPHNGHNKMQWRIRDRRRHDETND